MSYTSNAHRLEFLDLLLCLEISKLLEEGYVGGEGVGLKEVEETEQLLHAVLERGAREEDPVLHAESLEPLQQLAVSVLEAVGLVNDHHPPVYVL